MDDQTLERVEGWESRPVSGFDGLRDLADEEFSGAVRAGATVAFLLNGRVVGVFDGDLEDFRDASATAAAAPHVSLPLLLAMRERGGETQARYYTNDTSLSEVDQTLSDANFTGYVELSENVLSGDYYLVYHGGNRMTVAFVGTSEEMKTDAEAWDLATDEVGIYEVVRVDVDVQDVPEAEGESDGAAAAAVGTTDEDEDEEADDDAEDAATDPEPASEPEPEPEVTPDEPADPEPASSDADQDSDPDPTTGDAVADAEPSGGDPAEQTPEGEDPFEEEEAWRETVSIPAVAPDESAPDAGGTPPETDAEEGGSTAAAGGAAAATTESTRQRSRDAAEKLQAALEERTEELEAARERLSTLSEERDELEAERDDLQSEVADLRDEVAELRSELEQAKAGAATESGGAGGEALSPAAALDGTDLFVRYGSRGEATLEDVADGATATEVTANLRIDHHTQFESEDVRVDGVPFEAFLEDTVEYGFLRWLVEDLPFEIRNTGHEGALKDLYAALPEIDRAELGGEIEIEGEEGVERRSFDVVVRDRMGSPLVVADLNDRLEPVSGEMMDALVESAETITTGEDDVASAFYVTTSFFEPDALEVAQDATGGGFLSRDKRASYVKTARKRGFHLCLVETRDGSFYLNVPEL